MKKIVTPMALAAAVLATQVYATECYDDQGRYIEVPAGYKVMMAPWWVDPTKLIAPVTPGLPLPEAEEPTPEPQPDDECVGDDELSVGGSQPRC